MALDRLYAQANKTLPNLTVTASAKSGDPMVIGQIPCVLLTDADSLNTAIVQADGIFNLSVKGVNSGGNNAVALGDILYYNSGATPKVNKDSGGVRFGYSLGAVGSGSTATIAVQIGY